MTRTLAPGAALVAALALIAAGCGGDSEPEVSASTQWAGDLCTAVSTWKSSISTIASTLAGNPTKDGLESAASDAQDSTETLIDTVKGLGSPGTESGDQAKSTVESLAELVAVRRRHDPKCGRGRIGRPGAAHRGLDRQWRSREHDLGALVLADRAPERRERRQRAEDSFSEAESCNGAIPAGS